MQVHIENIKQEQGETLVNHMKTHEPGYKNETFVCEPCNITYKAKFNLRRHIRVFHEGIKPYVCEVCKQAFSNTNVSYTFDILNIEIIFTHIIWQTPRRVALISVGKINIIISFSL